jgi:hypothetical protein
VKFSSDRMSCIKVRGLWCNIIARNVYVPTEDKTDDIVAYLLKARTVEPEKQPLLGNVRTQQ